MPSGPLPNPKRRRQNAPTIPTTNLPAAGRPGPIPRLPRWVELGPAGSAWWKWAWKTPQAAAWSTGATVVIARRASLEDDLATVGAVESLDLAQTQMLDAESERSFQQLIRRLAGLAGGRLGICREMRELDDRLGLTPKGMAALRWEIVADKTDDTDDGEADEVTRRREERKARLATGS